MHSIESHYSLRGTGLMCVCVCVCVFHPEGMNLVL